MAGGANSLSRVATPASATLSELVRRPGIPRVEAIGLTPVSGEGAPTTVRSRNGMAMLPMRRNSLCLPLMGSSPWVRADRDSLGPSNRAPFWLMAYCRERSARSWAADLK